MSRKYIVGVDFGSHTTKACVATLNATIGTQFNVEPLRLQTRPCGNEYILQSKVYKDRDNKYSLYLGSCCSIVEKMKRRISELHNEPAIAEAYRAYIKLVVEALVNNNTFLKLDGEDGSPNFRICMSAPTQWAIKEKKDYLRFFNEAIDELGDELGLGFEWIINDSDAAFFSHWGDKVGQDDVTLVIDYGASMINYTVVHKGKKVSKDEWSNSQLGADAIGDIILHSYIADDFEGFQQSTEGTAKLLREYGYSNPYSTIYNVLKYRCQEVAEMAYTMGQDNAFIDFSFASHTGGNFSQFRRFRFDYDFDLSEITKNYCNAVRCDIERIKAKVENNTGKSTNKVILSGGACIMNWVHKIVYEIFPNADII